MIETHIQITCDGCGETEVCDIANTSKTAFRVEMKKYSWRNYGNLDYCGDCVKKGRLERKESMFTSNPPNHKTKTPSI